MSRQFLLLQACDQQHRHQNQRNPPFQSVSPSHESGFDFFQANLYYRHVDLTIGGTDYERDTYQFTPVYGTHFGNTGISFKGFIDLTGYNIGTQNQLLYEVTRIGGKPVHIGIEHLYYKEFKNDFTSSDPGVDTSSVQMMMKFTW